MKSLAGGSVVVACENLMESTIAAKYSAVSFEASQQSLCWFIPVRLPCHRCQWQLAKALPVIMAELGNA